MRLLRAIPHSKRAAAAVVRKTVGRRGFLFIFLKKSFDKREKI